VVVVPETVRTQPFGVMAVQVVALQAFRCQVQPSSITGLQEKAAPNHQAIHQASAQIHLATTYAAVVVVVIGAGELVITVLVAVVALAILVVLTVVKLLPEILPCLTRPVAP
jgi:Flp pilus assembly protein TadB